LGRGRILGQGRNLGQGQIFGQGQFWVQGHAQGHGRGQGVCGCPDGQCLCVCLHLASPDVSFDSTESASSGLIR